MGDVVSPYISNSGQTARVLYVASQRSAEISMVDEHGRAIQDGSRSCAAPPIAAEEVERSVGRR